MIPRKDIALKQILKTSTDTDLVITARLNTKFAFTYGKVEIRAKLPSGVGTWPALWTLGKNISERGAYWQTQGFGNTSWPECGEIDIMEHWGHNQNFVQSAIHSPSSFGNTINKGGQSIPTVSDEFHTYTLIWTEEKMIFKVDDMTHYVYHPQERNSATWPFDADQYLLFNFAILPTIESSFTSGTMEIDYVRIYQQGTTGYGDSNAIKYLDAYPNPVKDEITIPLESVQESDVRVEIFNINGTMVKDSIVPVNESEVNIKNLDALPMGTYLLNLILKNNKFIVKFIKS